MRTGTVVFIGGESVSRALAAFLRRLKEGQFSIVKVCDGYWVAKFKYEEPTWEGIEVEIVKVKSKALAVAFKPDWIVMMSTWNSRGIMKVSLPNHHSGRRRDDLRHYFAGLVELLAGIKGREEQVANLLYKVIGGRSGALTAQKPSVGTKPRIRFRQRRESEYTGGC